MDSRFKSDGEAVKRKYGTDDLQALQRTLTAQKEQAVAALEKQGYDYKDMAGYEQMLGAKKRYEDTQERIAGEIRDNPMAAVAYSALSVPASKEKVKRATQIIRERFVGKIIGTDDPVFVNWETAREYGHPAKPLSCEVRDVKMRAATELDNLVDAGFNFRTKPDGADGHIHPKATDDYIYFDTTFKVGQEYYSGVVNVEQNARGRRLKDITKIRNITQDIRGSYGETPATTILHDVSTHSMP